MLIFGGETSDGALQNTMWRFDIGKEVIQYRMMAAFLTSFRLWTEGYPFCDERDKKLH